MRILGFSILIALISTGSIRAEPAADQQVLDAVKAPDLTVVHCGRLGARIVRLN